MEPDRKKIIKACLIYFLLFVVLSSAALVKFMFFSGVKNHSASFFSGYFLLILGLFLIILIYALYGIISRKHLVNKLNELLTVCFCIATTYITCIFLVNTSIFVMPMFLTAFLLAPLCKRKDCFAANLFCIAMIVFTLSIRGISGELMSLQLFGSFVVSSFSGTMVVLFLSYERKRLDFLLKGCAICLFTVFLTLIADLLSLNFMGASGYDSLIKTLAFCSAAVFSQLVLTLLFQPVLEKLFNLLTNLRMIELSDHHSPLIRRLITEAPGTFNHSLTVANFAEVCATAIGENPYMARVCAYYHDIGKLSKPIFFKENQPEGNPHDDILPEVSAQIIRNHTSEGLILCKENKIPAEIAKITVEHHGTMPISVFYNKAQSLSDAEVDVKDYSYSGSKPTTKIAAIIMICDSAEAAIRATGTTDVDKADKIVNSLIWDRIQTGQFEACPITLSDLNTIRETIVGACYGIYHKRLAYPKG